MFSSKGFIVFYFSYSSNDPFWVNFCISHEAWEIPNSSVGKKIRLQCKRPQFDSWVRKIHWRRDRLPTPVFLGFPCGSAGKESAHNAGDLGSIPGLGRSPREGKGCPLQCSGLENSMDCIVHGVAIISSSLMIYLVCDTGGTQNLKAEKFKSGLASTQTIHWGVREFATGAFIYYCQKYQTYLWVGKDSLHPCFQNSVTTVSWASCSIPVF